MSFIRQAALPIYRWATQSQRRVLARRFSASQRWPAAILFYHRVANHTLNPWTISHDCFTEQLDFVESIASFASLDEIRQDQRLNVRQKLKVAITFDDGYGDNMEWAIPELVRRAIPCTYFVSTDYVESGLPFPHDVEQGKTLRPNSIAEIQQMADAGIQIGGHTRSHLDLGQAWSEDRLRRELCDSRKKLQDWTGQAIEYFAFPYGMLRNISQESIDMVNEAGYRAFLSAYGAWNFPTGDDVHLTRFHGDPCTEAVRNWLTLDPRRIEPREVLQYKKPFLGDPSKVPISESSARAKENTASFPSIAFGDVPLSFSERAR